MFCINEPYYAKPIPPGFWPRQWRIMLTLFIPEYLGREWHYKNAFVKKLYKPGENHRLSPFDYFALVEFDKYQDIQTLYPNGHQTRRGYVSISRRLYEAKPHSLGVFCQYNRLINGKHLVKLRIAR